MNPIILAADFSTLEQADEIIGRVRSHIGMLKIGPELFYAYGRDALELGVKHHLPIFLDLKLHDIPNTVARSVDIIATKFADQYKIRYLSAHAFGGEEMMKAAVKTAKGSDMQIAAVTLLTSIERQDLVNIGFTDRREGTKTIDLAVLAWNSGARTFVCAPAQTNLMRKHLDEPNERVTLITPGIRAAEAPEDDQKRTKPIGYAIKNGADWVVVGRPITQDSDPEAAAQNLLAQALKAQK